MISHEDVGLRAIDEATLVDVLQTRDATVCECVLDGRGPAELLSIAYQANSSDRKARIVQGVQMLTYSSG
jgi:hypothetical protein